MYKEILDLLRCPKCNGELGLTIEKEEYSEIIEGRLSCDEEHHWAIRYGVINFGSVEQEFTNNWSETFEQYDAEELDKKIAEGNPQNLVKIGDEAKRFIIDIINGKENEFILDIATGRGSLFIDMLKQLKLKSQLICTDLSFVVLKHDRIQAKKVNPEVKVNYIACDATNLPFKDNTIDTAVTFCGIQNMMNLAGDGIKEAKRVLKTGQSLLDSNVIIKEHSEGFKTLNGICRENNIIGAEEFFIKAGIEKAYNKAKFHSTNIVTIGESIGEKSDLDLIPFAGEWFAVVVVESIK